jgi:hypothetical protein
LRETESRFGFAFMLFLMLLASGCAFDVMHLKYGPAQIDCNLSGTRCFILEEDVVLKDLPCGYTRTLKKEKKWRLFGRIEQGEVFKPVGHSFTVECSNVFEAYLVMKEDQLCGFYLPVEKGFVGVKPIKLTLKQTDSEE